MTDVADDIRAAVNQTRPPSALKTQGREPDDLYAQLRADIQGALIRAHSALAGPNRPWAPVDTRIIDINDQWLKQLAGR